MTKLLEKIHHIESVGLYEVFVFSLKRLKGLYRERYGWYWSFFSRLF